MVTNKTILLSLEFMIASLNNFTYIHKL